MGSTGGFMGSTGISWRLYKGCVALLFLFLLQRSAGAGLHFKDLLWSV